MNFRDEDEAIRHRQDELLELMDHEERVEIQTFAVILRRLGRIEHKVDLLLAKNQPSPPTGFIQTQGANMLTGTIKGLLAGATDTFFSTPVDKNGVADALPTGSLTGGGPFCVLT